MEPNPQATLDESDPLDEDVLVGEGAGSNPTQMIALQVPFVAQDDGHLDIPGLRVIRA